MGFLLPPEAPTGSKLNVPRKPPLSHVPHGTGRWPPVPPPATRLHIPDCKAKRCWLMLGLGFLQVLPDTYTSVTFPLSSTQKPQPLPPGNDILLKEGSHFPPSIFCPQGVPWLQLGRALLSALPELGGGWEEGEEVSACILAPSSLQRGLWTCTSHHGAYTPSTSLDKIDSFSPSLTARPYLIRQKACCS